MRSKRFKQDQKNPRNQTKKRKKKIKRKNYNKTKWKKKERKVCFLEQYYGNHSCHSNDHFLFFWLCSPPPPPSLSLSFHLVFYSFIAHWHHSIGHDLNRDFTERFLWETRDCDHNFDILITSVMPEKKGCGYCWLNTEQVWVSGHSFYMPTKESPLS